MQTLLVENHDPTRRLLTELLTAEGHRVSYHALAEDALAADRRLSFPLIILDADLENGAGLALCRDIRSRPGGEHRVILALTSGTRPEDLERLLEAGADDYVAKPVDIGVFRVRLSLAARKVNDLLERRQAIQALRESEDLFRSLVQTAGSVIVVLSPDHQILEFNREAERAFGWGRTEVLGKDYFEVFLRADIQRGVESNIRRVLSGIPTRDYEYPIRTRTGDERVLVWNVSRVLDPEGEPIGVITIGQDITARKRAEAALKDSEERFRAIVEATPVPIVIARRQDGVILYANQQTATEFGISHEDLIGREGKSLFLDPAEHGALLQAVTASGRLGNYEARLRRPDGSVFWVVLSALPATFEREDAMVVGLYDITERKRMEVALRDVSQGVSRETGEAFFETLVRYLAKVLGADAAYVAELVDGSGARLRTIARCRRDDILDNVEFDVRGTACAEALTDDLSLVRRDAATQFPSDPLLAEIAAQSMIGARLQDSNGAPLGILAMLHSEPLEDGSPAPSMMRIFATRAAAELERTRSEEARLRLETQMQQAQKLESLGVLAGGIAHDFNNLLTGILGNASLAALELPAESPVLESVRQIELASRRASELTNQMLAYAGKGTFAVQPVRLDELVAEMAQLLETVISKTVVLRFEIDEDLPPVEADASQIRQVVMNLITNASDAIGDRSGEVVIRTSRVFADRAYLAGTYLADGLEEGEYVFVEVSDSGLGMDPATQARIFDPFFTTKFTGRGLGLAAVLGIVRGHRGALELKSAPEDGTTIRVLLPASTKPADGLPAADPVADSWRGSGTILVVDDEVTVRTVARRTLERYGFKVVTAADGREGLHAFRTHIAEIRAVLLDMTMPHLDGKAAFEGIRECDPEARVLLMSGYTQEDAAGRFAPKGLAGFIQKPFHPQSLIAKMREVLETTASSVD